VTAATTAPAAAEATAEATAPAAFHRPESSEIVLNPPRLTEPVLLNDVDEGQDGDGDGDDAEIDSFPCWTEY
jgi:hypothetical protein